MIEEFRRHLQVIVAIDTIPGPGLLPEGSPEKTFRAGEGGGNQPVSMDFVDPEGTPVWFGQVPVIAGKAGLNP